MYFIAADPDETADAVEQRYVELVEAVRAEITIPLAVKIGPFFSSVGHIAHRLVAAGADGLVLFNRFMQPDIDLENLTVDPSLHLSTSDELALPLRWIGVLRDRVHASLACTTGVHTAEDALKVLLVGADVTMMASALLHEGPAHVTTVLDGIADMARGARLRERRADEGLDEHAQRAEPGGLRAGELRPPHHLVHEPVRLADG